jgi:hypothetical protein
MVLRQSQGIGCGIRLQILSTGGQQPNEALVGRKNSYRGC